MQTILCMTVAEAAKLLADSLAEQGYIGGFAPGEIQITNDEGTDVLLLLPVAL